MHAIREEISPPEGHLTESLIECSKMSNNDQHQTFSTIVYGKRSCKITA